MKNKFFVLLFVLSLSFTNCALALSEGLSVTVLPSGQKVVIKEVHDNPTVKIDTWINTGSINEDDKTTGISHFLEHLFFKGTQKNPTGTFDKILDSKGASVNAGTSKDFTHYYIEIPSKDFDLALSLHADMLLNPMIPRKELERERPVVIEEISKTKDSPSTRMMDNLYSLIYSKSDHPYKRTVIGKKDVIESVTREEILSYFNKFYTPDAYTTVIVGDVNKDETLKKVAQAFKQNDKEKQEKRKQVKIKYPKVKPIEKIERVYDSMDINKTHLMIGFLAPKFGSSETFALDVLSTMLTDGKSSILNQNLKERKDLVLSINSGNYSQKDSGIFYIYSVFNPKNEKAVEENIISELKKIQEGDFDESLIQKAKNIIKTDTYYSRESISNISDDLGYDFTFSKDENYYDNYLKNIDKVTKKDIISAMNNWLELDKYVVSCVRPMGFSEVSAVIEENETKKEETKTLEEKGNTLKVELENGAKLITRKKKVNSIVAIDITIKGTKAIEKKPASAFLASQLIQRDTENFTNSQLADYLDENGIKLAVNSTADAFSILMQTTVDNVDKAFIVLDEIINKPSFLNSETEKIKQRKIQELSTVSDSPSSYVFDEFKKLAFLNTIYGQNSEYLIKAIKNITRDDIVEFYSRLINPNNMSIAVVGDINPNEIAQKFNKILKPNPKGKTFSYSDVKYEKYIPSKNVEKTLYKNEVQANWLALGYKVPGVTNRKDAATLNVINSILGEGMSSRLFTKLREEKGLAYTVGSTLSLNVLDGSYIAYIGTRASSVEEAKQGILNEIETIKKEMVTTKELNDAKDKIIGKLLLSIETNMDEANLLSKYSTLGRDLEALEEYKNLIMSTTQADIIETANRYFSKPYIYVVVKEGAKQNSTK